jgi:hypothetical protein
VPAADADGVVDIAGDGAGITEIGACPDPSNPDDYGCVNYGVGNTVWHDGSVDDDFYVSAGGGAGTIDRLTRYGPTAAPDDYEMRFTAEGGLAVYGFTDFQITNVPFEIWNVGNPDVPEDDVRMIPFLNPNGTQTTNWEDSFTGVDTWAESPCAGGCPITDWVYWMMPDRPNGYDLFEAAAEAFGGPGAIYDTTGTVDGDTQVDFNPVTGASCANQSVYADWCFRIEQLPPDSPDLALEFVYPIGRFVVADLAQDGTTPPVGTVIRVPYVPEAPVISGDVIVFNTSEVAFVTDDQATAEAALEMIGAVPNPYMGASEYETVNTDRIVRFVNIPDLATIRIYTVAGALVKTFQDVTGPSVDWDLTTSNNLPVASGMYLVHVDVPDVGERVLKLGIINRRNRVGAF